MEKKEEAITEEDLKSAISRVVIKFLKENRDEILKRAHRLLKEDREEKKDV